MNFKNFFLVGALVASLAACGSSYKSQTKIETRADSVAYLMGAIDGGRQKATYEHFGLDTLLDFDTYFEHKFFSEEHKKILLNIMVLMIKNYLYYSL